jgi:hypothetical protein
MSNFDAASFASMSFEGQNDTKLVPIPVGEYVGVITDIAVNTWQGKEDPTKSGLKLSATIELDKDLPEPGGSTIGAVTGRDKNTVKHDVMLDVSADGKGLDMGKGKNVSLGRLREAVGLNNPGQPFSFQMLVGRPVKVMIAHRPYKEDLFAEVKGVAKAN